MLIQIKRGGCRYLLRFFMQNRQTNVVDEAFLKAKPYFYQTNKGKIRNNDDTKIVLIIVFKIA